MAFEPLNKKERLTLFVRKLLKQSRTMSINREINCLPRERCPNRFK